MVEREQGGEVGDDILMEFRGGGQRVLCLGSCLCICIEHCALHLDYNAQYASGIKNLNRLAVIIPAGLISKIIEHINELSKMIPEQNWL